MLNPLLPPVKKAILCGQAALDRKAENVQILEVTQFSSLADYFVICSGSSQRQVQGIADGIKKTLQNESIPFHLTTEGYSDGRWILLDFQNVIVHIFLDILRDYYQLEELWAIAPKIAIPPTCTPKQSYLS